MPPWKRRWKTAPKFALTAVIASVKRAEDVWLIVLIVSTIWASELSRSAFWAESSRSRVLDLVLLERRVVDGAEPLEGERLLDDVLGERGLERLLGERALLLGPLERGKLPGEAAELGAARLDEVILVGSAPLEAEVRLEARAPRGVERLACGGAARLGGTRASRRAAAAPSTSARRVSRPRRRPPTADCAAPVEPPDSRTRARLVSSSRRASASSATRRAASRERSSAPAAASASARTRSVRTSRALRAAASASAA